MQNHRGYRVTLYHRISLVELPEMLEVINRFERKRQITGHSDLIFHTPNHRGNGDLPVMSNACLSMLLRRMGFQGRQTPHGYRGFG